MRYLDILMVMVSVPLAGAAVAPRLHITDDVTRARTARDTWDVDGGGQLIAVIDTGVDNADISVPMHDGVHRDETGHGTAMVQCIKTIAPNVRIASLDVFDPLINEEYVLRALRWVAARDDVAAVNMSLSLYRCSFEARDLIKDLRDRGIPVVTSSGNQGKGHRKYMLFPAAFHETISVGAVDVITGEIAYFCSRQGAIRYPVHQTDVLAPGVGVWINGQRTSGTSQSSAFTCAAIALFREAYLDRFGVPPSVDQIENALRSSGPRVEDPAIGETFGSLDVFDFIDSCVPEQSAAVDPEPLLNLKMKVNRSGRVRIRATLPAVDGQDGELAIVVGTTSYGWVLSRGRGKANHGKATLKRGKLRVRINQHAGDASSVRVYFNGRVFSP